jgi:hypothetical protein
MNYETLEKEGITKDFLETISIKKLGNPAQLEPGDEPVHLLPCARGFWISVNGELLKDLDNDYIVVSPERALVARARYLVNFQEEITKQQGKVYEQHLAKEIAIEVKRLTALTIKETEKLLDQLKFTLQLSGELEGDIVFTIKKNALIQDGDFEEASKTSKEITSNPEYLRLYETLAKWNLEGNYDELYSYLFQNGTYQVAQFDEKSIDTLIKFFHKNKIEKTIEELQRHSHIENVAKFNVEKKLKNNLQ